MSDIHRNDRPRKDVKLQVRIERPLAERLQHAAAENGLEPSDKLRRILDAVLPPLPNKNAA